MSLRQYWLYYLLSFLFLALLPICALIFNGGSMDFTDAGASATASTGIVWNSNILNVLRLSFAEPVLLLTLLGSAAPALAAIVLLVFRSDANLWSRFRQRLCVFRECEITEALLTYAVMITLLVATLFLVFEIRGWLGADYDRGVSINASLLLAILAIAFLDQGALLEELGWRGFAQPELERLLQHPLNAAVIVGLCWGLWHLPRDITMGVIDDLGITVYLTQFLPAFLLGTVSVSIIIAFFMNRLGGSLLVAVVVHGVTNDAIGISGSASIAEALTPFHQITKNLPFAVIALAMIAFYGRELGRRQLTEAGV